MKLSELKGDYEVEEPKALKLSDLGADYEVEEPTLPESSEESAPGLVDTGRALSEGAAQEATLGLADELAAGAYGTFEDLKSVFTSDPVEEQLARDEFGRIVPEDAAKSNFDDLVATSEEVGQEVKEADPNAYLAGEVAGSLATAAIPGGAALAPSLAAKGTGMLAKGAGKLADNVVDAAPLAAAQYAAQDAPIEGSDIASDAAAAALLPGMIQGSAKLAKSTFGKLGDAAKPIADKATIRAAGLGKDTREDLVLDAAEGGTKLAETAEDIRGLNILNPEGSRITPRLSKDKLKAAVEARKKAEKQVELYENMSYPREAKDTESIQELFGKRQKAQKILGLTEEIKDSAFQDVAGSLKARSAEAHAHNSLKERAKAGIVTRLASLGDSALSAGLTSFSQTMKVAGGDYGKAQKLLDAAEKGPRAVQALKFTWEQQDPKARKRGLEEDEKK